MRSSLNLTIEGVVIVSADGMIADANGVQPDSLKPDADQRFFRERLDAADALVHGRYSGEGGPAAAGRRRIILTRQLKGVGRDRDNSNAVLWNPAGAPFEDAVTLLRPAGGRIAVIGGTEVFGLFLDYGYDVFQLSRAATIRLPGGRPVFPGVPGKSPDELLAEHGLKPDATRVLDGSIDLTLITWRR